LADGYYRAGRYRQATDLREQVLTTNKADFQRIRNSITSELAEKYETDKKDRTIAFQQDLLAQQRRTQWLTGGIVALLLLGLLGLFVGLRNNRRKNVLLEKRNGENELLLREIHHRVKSMVLLHQKLYQHDKLAGIEMKEYLISLTHDLLSSHGESDRLAVSVDMDTLVLDVDQAVPVGLIVNELKTNALKYAYPPGFLSAHLSGEVGAATGAIKVGLSMARDDYMLTVSDRGVGKTAGAAPDDTGFCSQLIDLLTRQLGGTLTETSHGGLTVELRFPAPGSPGPALRR
jgi:two-component sensor histidine kinase